MKENIFINQYIKIYKILLMVFLCLVPQRGYPSAYETDIQRQIRNEEDILFHKFPRNHPYQLLTEPDNLRHRIPGSLQKAEFDSKDIPKKVLKKNISDHSLNKIYSVEDLKNIATEEEALKSSLEYYDALGKLKKVKKFIQVEAAQGITDSFYVLAFMHEKELEEENFTFSEREAAFTQAVHWYTKAYDGWQQESCFDKAEKADQALKRVMENYSKEQEEVKIFKENTLKWFSAHKKSRVIDQATPFFQNVYNLDEKIAILRAVSRIPLRDQDYVLEKIHPYLTDVKDGKNKAAIIRAIRSIPISDLENTLEKATPFFQGIKDGKGRADIIRALGKVSNMQNSDFILEALPLFLNDVKEGKERAALIRALGNIPSQNFKKYVKRLPLLLEDIQDGKEKAFIIEALSTVPVKNLKKLVQEAPRYLKHAHGGQRKANIIKAIQKGLDQSQVQFEESSSSNE